jgi:hypothetical protein
MANNIEHCAHCGFTISEAEIPHIWQETIVCPACYEKLARSTSQPPPPPRPSTTSRAAPTMQPAASGNRPSSTRSANPFEPAPIAATFPQPQHQVGYASPGYTPEPRPPAGHSVPAIMILMIGIFTLLEGTCIGGLVGLGAAALAARGSAVNSLVLVQIALTVLLAYGIGTTDLICWRKVRRGSRGAATITLVGASVQILMNLYIIFTNMGEILTHPMRVPQVGSPARSGYIGHEIGLYAGVVVAVLLVATLVVTIIFLARILMGSSASHIAPPRTYSAPSPPRPESMPVPPAPPPAADVPQWMPAAPGNLAKARGTAARILLVLGIVTIVGGAGFGGCMGIAALSNAAPAAASGVLIATSMLLLAGACGFGITYLICRRNLLRGSRAAAIVALVVSGVQILFNGLVVCLALVQMFQGPRVPSAPGPMASGESLGHMAGSCGIAVASAAMVAALIQLIVCLIKVLNGSAPITASWSPPARNPSLHPEPQNQPGGGKPKTPSIFVCALAGYALASIASTILVIILDVFSGHPEAAKAMDILTPFGALGACLGYDVAVRWRRSLGVSVPKDHWRKFWGSPTFIWLALIVILGSFVLAMAISFGFRAVAPSAGATEAASSPPAAVSGSIPAAPVSRMPERPAAPLPTAPIVTPPPTPPVFSQAQQDAKLMQVLGSWQPVNGGSTSEMLYIMRGQTQRDVDGTTLLPPGRTLVTTQPVGPPVTFRLIVQTHGGDLRIGHPAHQIIFNWEMNRDELRVDGGPASGRHKPGAGRLLDDQWVGIELVVRADEMVIYVDGQERYRTSADFSKIHAPLTITNHGQTPLKIRSVTQVHP